MKINKQESNYEVNCTYEDSYEVIIEFQNKKISLRTIFNEYMTDIRKNQTIEVLPGVYIKVNFNLNNVVMPKYNPYDSLYGLIKSLVLAIKTRILQNVSIKVFITVNNKKDYINIYNNEELGISNEKDYYYESEYESYKKRISPKILPYPDTLGRGAGRCVVWNIFQTLGLLESGCESAYEFYTLSQLLDMTSNNNNLLNKCKESRNCGYIIDKMINNEYKGKWEGGNGCDDISVGFEEGKYRLYEGKHRVCMAKRFNITTIPVEVTEIVHKKKKYHDSDLLRLHRLNQNYTCHEIMDDFYSTLTRIGLNKEDSHKLLNNDFIDIVEFIEKKVGKNIIKIRNICNAENERIFREEINNFSEN